MYLVDRLLIGLLCFVIGLIVNSYAVIMVSVAAMDSLLFEIKNKLHMC